MQRFGVERRPVEVEATGKLSGEVLCISGAATVTTEVDLSASSQGCGDHVRCLLDTAEEFGIVQYRQFRGDGLLDGLGDSGVHDEFKG